MVLGIGGLWDLHKPTLHSIPVLKVISDVLISAFQDSSMQEWHGQCRLYKRFLNFKHKLWMSLSCKASAARHDTARTALRISSQYRRNTHTTSAKITQCRKGLQVDFVPRMRATWRTRSRKPSAV
eukprot:4860634-Amphidinium_carterae.2